MNPIPGVFNALGVETTVVVRTDAILRSFDQVLGTQLLEQMKADGVKFETHDSIERVDKDGEVLKVTTRTGKVIQDVGCLLWAIGRDPYVKELGEEIMQTAVAIESLIRPFAGSFNE